MFTSRGCTLFSSRDPAPKNELAPPVVNDQLAVREQLTEHGSVALSKPSNDESPLTWHNQSKLEIHIVRAGFELATQPERPPARNVFWCGDDDEDVGLIDEAVLKGFIDRRHVLVALVLLPRPDPPGFASW